MTTGSDQRSRSSSTGQRLALLAVLSVAAFVRFWGIDFGLPNPECRPDESHLIRTALRFSSGDLNPHVFNYPTLYMYVLFFLYGCYYLLGALWGRFPSRTDFLAEYALDPSNVYLIDRGLSALLGTATVWIIYMICARSLDRRTGLVAALFLSLAHLHVRDSHFGVTDVPMVFLIMCSVLFMSKIHTHPTRTNYLLAGVFAGLAMSTKYSGLFLVVPLVVSHVLVVRPANVGILRSLIDRRMTVFALGMGLAFFGGTPFALVDFPTFVSGVRFEALHLSLGDRIDLGRGWWYHVRFTLWHGLGWSLWIASLAGAFALARRRPNIALVLGSFPMVYFAIAGKALTVFLRYMMPVVPFLCIAAAVFAVSFAEVIARGGSPHVKSVTTLILACLIISPSTHNVIRSNTLLGEPDSRLLAASWAQAHLAGGSSVYETGSWERLRLPETRESLERTAEPASGAIGGIKAEMNRIIADHQETRQIKVFEEWTYDPESRKFKFGHEIRDDRPRYIITASSPRLTRNRLAPGIQELLEDSDRLRKSFAVIDRDRKDNFFDQQDAFYLPFSGFHGVRGPGPNIDIFERADSWTPNFVPTGSSWRNLVEGWLGEITRERIRRGAFRNVPELAQGLETMDSAH